ncbi:MAG TPA: proline dehydrogenase family protein [Terriglobia bacterium]|nr:proline dehydrogenase family protein [Terriglobia bacterium]
MLRSLLLYLSERETAKNILTHLPGGRRLPQRFIAGEHLDDAVRVVRQLNGEGFDATLDHLGESVDQAAAAEESCRTYIEVLDRLAAEKLRSHISVKLTALGLAFDEELCKQHLHSICECAARHHNFVRIDMEGSAYTEKTLRVFHEAGAPRDVLGVVIQSYLYRSDKDVQDLTRAGARVRLVKGAYKEPPDVAFPRKTDADANFVKLMKLLLASDGYHAIATHDPRMIASTKVWARANGVPADHFEFQMLFGIRRNLQHKLLDQGYRMRIYVPYGRQWYAYFMRRLAERPANVLFLARNLFRS